MFNKSFITNLVAFGLAVCGKFSPIYPEALFSVGIFAFSGAITNWIAIHMLFEKVPFFYGSGIIPNRFEEFKVGLRELIMNQFFTKENIDKWLNEFETQSIDLQPVLDGLQYETMFEGLVATIKESSFGSMLGMFGGEQALVPLKEPFILKIQASLKEMVGTDQFQETLHHAVSKNNSSAELISKIDGIVSARLEELTPNMVKVIIQDMIRKHLGWLVVWGGVFGGIIGLISSFI